MMTSQLSSRDDSKKCLQTDSAPQEVTQKTHRFDLGNFLLIWQQGKFFVNIVESRPIKTVFIFSLFSNFSLFSCFPCSHFHLSHLNSFIVFFVVLFQLFHIFVFLPYICYQKVQPPRRAYFQLLREALAFSRRFFGLSGKPKNFTQFVLNLGNCWLSLVTSVTFTSNLSNFENNPKISKIQRNKKLKKSHQI